MLNKEKRPAEMEAPTGTVTMTFPDYNMFSGEEQEKAMEIMELFWMALQVSGLSDRDSDEKPQNTLPAMFTESAGHVSVLKFRCYMNGYTNKCDLRNYDEYQEREIKTNDPVERFLKNADCIKRWLHGILEGMRHDRV